MFALKDLSLSILLDIYGKLLNEKQWRIFNDYYNEDLSLSEISDKESMTRQAVHETLKRVEQMLYSFEDKLKLKQTISEFKQAAAEQDTQKLYELIEKL